MARMRMSIEITCAVAGLAIATIRRTERGVGGGGIGGASGGVMAGSTGVMNLVIGRINRGGQ